MSATIIDGGILRKHVGVVRNNSIRPNNQRTGLGLMETLKLLRAMRAIEQATAHWVQLKTTEQDMLRDTAFVLLDVFVEIVDGIDAQPGKNFWILFVPHTWSSWYLVNRSIKLARGILFAAENEDIQREQILAERIKIALEDAPRSKGQSLGVTEAREFIRGL